MSTSADLVQVSIVPEVVYGVTPANPVFYIVRTTGEGLAFAPTTTTSNEMNPLRQVTDSILTGGQSTGDLNFELAYEAWFDLLLAGAMCADWVDLGANDRLRMGTELLSFTVEKKIPVPGGTTQYHRFTGCTMNQLDLDIKPNAAITGKFTIIGKGVDVATTAIAGSSYVSPLLNPVMTAPKVVGIEIGTVSAVSKCFNSLTLSLNNNNRAIECIGTLGPKETVLGRAEVTSSFQVLFNDSDLLLTMLNQTETELGFTTEDTHVLGSPNQHNGYKWLLPRVKFTADPVVAGGTNTDVINAVTAQGLMNLSTSTSLEITRFPSRT